MVAACLARIALPSAELQPSVGDGDAELGLRVDRGDRRDVILLAGV
jgi:hypothetical protein